MAKANPTNSGAANNLVKELILTFGEDATREGLKETPQRVVKMYKELLSGYTQNEKELYKLFASNGYHEVVTVANIDFYSLCEHHMIPFFGRVHIGYVPNGHLLGLSKFARLVDMFSRRLQTQENITNQLAESLQKNLNPKGLIVHVEAEHLCVSMRGIKKKGFTTKTTAKKGQFIRNQSLVNQFFQDISLDKRNYDRN